KEPWGNSNGHLRANSGRPPRGKVTILRKKLTICHLLPDDWIRTNLQQVRQRIGRDALGDAIHRAGDDAQDALLPLVYFAPNRVFMWQWARSRFPFCRSSSTRKTSPSVLGSIGLPVRSDTMSWQISSCSRPKPAAFSTILRSLTVGATVSLPAHWHLPRWGRSGPSTEQPCRRSRKRRILAQARNDLSHHEVEPEAGRKT